MSRLPGLTDQLVDDAAIFPPGNAPIAVALAAHTGWRESRYESIVGPLLIPASAIEGVRAHADPDALVAIGLIGDTGLDGLIAARDALQDDAWFTIEHVELAVPAQDGFDAAVRSLLEQLPFTVPTYLEIPAVIDPSPALGVIADDGAERAKFRCGPVVVPTSEELARFLFACVRHRVSFKLTAGLHHALPTPDVETGARHHGFLNTLAATWVAIDGADLKDVVHVLDETVADRVLTILDRADLARLRSLYRSFGSCSIVEPYDDLAALSLTPEGPP